MVQVIHKSIRLHPIQHAFCHSNALYRAFLGGRGSGKSWAGAYDLIRRALPNRHYMVVSPTWKQMFDTTWESFKAVAQELHVWDANLVQKGDGNVTLPNGAMIRFRSADNPDRLRGPNLSGVWMDEASLMHHDCYLIALAALRENGEHGWLSATFTPKGISHWTYEQFGKDMANAAVFHASMQENPFLPKDLQHQLEEQYGTRGLLARQELSGLFTNVEGAEWPAEFFKDILYTELPPSLPITCKVLTCDPSKGKDAKQGDYSPILLTLFTRDGHLWVDDSIITRMPTSQVEDSVISMYRKHLPHGVMVESNNYQEYVVDSIVRKCPRIPIYKQINKIAKPVRIRMALTPLLSFNRLHIRDTPHNRILLAQLRDFPVAEHDDGPDALELATQMINYLLKGKQQSQPKHRLVVK